MIVISNLIIIVSVIIFYVFDFIVVKVIIGYRVRNGVWILFGKGDF